LGKILIADDDADLRAVVKDVLKEEGFSVVEAKDGIDAVKLFKNALPDAVLLDMKMPYMDGLSTLRKLKQIDGAVPVIILTAHGDIPTAVEAIKCGAYDFTVKPPDFGRLIITIKRAVERRVLEAEVRRVNSAFESSLENQLGKSPSMKKVIKEIKQVAQTDFSVVIQGETGTGKSVVAALIHNLSKRADQPFVNVDIGLIPDLLVESELFGYKKGAFTGAERDRAGYLEASQGGTIFLDELENMSVHVQCKLLSFIEKKKIYPLGCTAPIDIDLRIIGATNKNIRECVARKEFREDLFYRLSEFIITLPPLRERSEDIPFFARKFLFDASGELNKQIREITDGALDILLKHHWPGNMRELKNVIRRAALFTDCDAVGRECIEILIREKDKDGDSCRHFPLKDAMRELEKNAIREAIERTGGNKSRAAQLLDISYKGLLDKIKEYDIR
jgi:DNA-binding NtrC family response regulator